MSIAETYKTEGLSPYATLPDITRPGWEPQPLLVKGRGPEGQHMATLGLAHRTDLGNPHHRALTNTTTDFMAAAPNGSRVILNEGGVWPIADSLDKAYMESGEARWLQTLGSQTDTPVISPEPLHGCANLLLAEGFTEEEIACFYFVRQAPQWHRIISRPDFETFMNNSMTNIANDLPWEFDFSLLNLMTLYEDTYGKHFDRNDIGFLYKESIGYMLRPTSRIQQASVVCNMGRDVQLLRTIREYFTQGISVFTGFGWSHVYVMKPVLEQLVTPADHERQGRVAQNLGLITLRS